MHKNRLWILFLSVITLVASWYTVHTGIYLWHYFSLDKTTTTEEIQWSVISLSDDQFVPLARYRFRVKDQQYNGQTQWKEKFLNQWTAEELIAKIPLATVWFDSTNPNISSLQRHFPLKDCIYTIFLLFLELYFIALGFYVHYAKSSHEQKV